MMGDLGKSADIQRYATRLQLLEQEIEATLRQLSPHPEDETMVREELIRIGATGILIGRATAGAKSAQAPIEHQRILAELAEATARACSSGRKVKLAMIDLEVATKIGCSASLVEKIRLRSRRAGKGRARRGSEGQ
jgi:hypothetical protein